MVPLKNISEGTMLRPVQVKMVSIVVNSANGCGKEPGSADRTRNDQGAQPDVPGVVEAVMMTEVPVIGTEAPVVDHHRQNGMGKAPLSRTG